LPHYNDIKTILFDLDGTLRHNRPSFNDKFFEYAVQLGSTNSLAQRQRAIRWAHYYWAQSPELFQDMAIYGELNDDFWEHYIYRNLVAFSCSEDEAKTYAPQLRQLIVEGYNPTSYIPPDVPDTLKTLKAAGFILGLLTNRSNPVDEELEKLGLTTYLEFDVVAGVVNSWKPDSGIFQHALELAGSLAEETIYIGDNYYADVVGATNAGIVPILVDPESVFPEAECTIIQSIGELRELLL
jgi:HAD superfamily hydrolase (TIGR01549 family)